MSRDEGFAIADTATSKLDDPKFRRLWRIVHDENAMNAAVVLHDAVQLASWAAGERVVAEDAAPFWMDDVPGTTANLQAVGLLDKDARLPEKAWESWFGVARDRRQKRRDAGLLGGRPKPSPNHTVSDANHTVNGRHTTDNPVPSVPSVPSYCSVPSVARENGHDLDLKITLEDDEVKTTRLRHILADPAEPDTKKQLARWELDRIGAVS